MATMYGSTFVTAIEAKHYNDARVALMNDPIVQDMAKGLAGETLESLAHDDGTPRFEFMQASNREYDKRGGTMKYDATNAHMPKHIGAVAEALLLILKEGIATMTTTTETKTTTATATSAPSKSRYNAAYAKAYRDAKRAEADKYPIKITLDF